MGKSGLRAAALESHIALQLFLENGTATVQAGANRADRTPRRLAHLFVSQALNICQYHYQPKLFRQSVQRSLNRLVQRLSHHRGVGRASKVDYLSGLKLAARARHAGVERLDTDFGSSPHSVNKRVPHDSEHPSVKMGSRPESRKTFKRFNESLLNQIFRFVLIAAEPVRHPVDCALVLSDKRLEPFYFIVAAGCHSRLCFRCAVAE